MFILTLGAALEALDRTITQGPPLAVAAPQVDVGAVRLLIQQSVAELNLSALSQYVCIDKVHGSPSRSTIWPSLFTLFSSWNSDKILVNLMQCFPSVQVDEVMTFLQVCGKGFALPAPSGAGKVGCTGRNVVPHAATDHSLLECWL